MATLTGCKLYVTHISCAGVIDHVRAARARGQKVRAEVCIHQGRIRAGLLGGRPLVVEGALVGAGHTGRVVRPG